MQAIIEIPAEGSARKRQVRDDLESVRVYLSELREKGTDRLPPERELAETLGLTRSRLRGALKKLAEEGMIWREVGNGTYFGQRSLVDVSTRTTDLSDLTNPREVMETRLLLEPELARLAAFRAKGDNIVELDLCLHKMLESTSVNDWAFWDLRFHRAIARAADNTMLLIILETVQKNMTRDTWGELANKIHRDESNLGSIRDHEAILAPIRNRDPEGAYEAMRAHLKRAWSIYFGV